MKARFILSFVASVLLTANIGCGGGSVSPTMSSMSSNAGGNTGSTGANAGGSSGSTTPGGSSGGGASGSAAPSASAFVYVGLDDAYSYYGNIAHTGHASIAGYSIASDGSLQPTPGSPYASPAMALVADGSTSTLYAASGQTLNTEHINADGSLTTTATLSAQPLSPSIGIYEDLSFDSPAHLLYAIANHGAGDEFFEIYRTSGDGSLANNGSQQGPVSTYHLRFTSDGQRAYEPFCYHLDSEIFGWNVGADGKLASFATKASIPTIDGTYPPCPHALAISPDGKFLAGPLNSVTTPAAALAIWTINSDGTLSATTGSPFLRSATASDIAWDSSGRCLAVAAKDGLWIYNFAAGGTPAPVGGGPIVAGAIDHLAFNKAGTLLFATNASAQTLYVFAFNSSTGAATPAPGSPHATSLAPYGLVMVER